MYWFCVHVSKSLCMLFRRDYNALVAWCIHSGDSPKGSWLVQGSVPWGRFSPNVPMGLQAGCGVLSPSGPEFPGDEFSAWFSLIVVGTRVLLAIQFYSPMDFVSRSSGTYSSVPREISSPLL